VDKTVDLAGTIVATDLRTSPDKVIPPSLLADPATDFRSDTSPSRFHGDDLIGIGREAPTGHTAREGPKMVETLFPGIYREKVSLR